MTTGKFCQFMKKPIIIRTVVLKASFFVVYPELELSHSCFFSHMTSPTVAVRSTVKNDTCQQKRLESIVKLDYVLTTILWVTSSGQTLKSTVNLDKRVPEIDWSLWYAIFFTACSIVYKYCTRPISRHLNQGYIRILLIGNTKSSKIDKINKCNVLCLKLEYFFKSCKT